MQLYKEELKKMTLRDLVLRGKDVSIFALGFLDFALAPPPKKKKKQQANKQANKRLRRHHFYALIFSPPS